ncbi:MAG: GNAT family N-acetyltransferase [Propionibacteriales bacterium]|nr:GNAT family N-acetyltransferase [Propionibacteriales bacterium]
MTRGILTPRPYADDDLPRLQHALAGWRREAGACGYCHLGDLAHRIYEELRGRPVAELVTVWESGSTVAAFAVCGRFGTSFDVFTSPALRGTDQEFEMLRTAYETTRRQLPETGDRWVVTDVFGCDDIRSDLLVRLGFERYRTWDHVTERGLAEPIDRPAVPDGFQVRSATLDDHEQLAAAHSSAFDAHWTPTAYRDQVMLRPGYHPDREIVTVAPDGRVGAFAVTWLDELNSVGLFEPVGTHRDFQRRGLARATMLHGLHELRRLGMATATVTYDATNLAAARLYSGLGFTRRYETLGFRRSGVRGPHGGSAVRASPDAR